MKLLVLIINLVNATRWFIEVSIKAGTYLVKNEALLIGIVAILTALLFRK